MKWDAWKAVAEEYKAKGKEAAQLRYCAIARGLGWTPDAAATVEAGPTLKSKSAPDEEPSAEELLESESVEERGSGRSGGLSVAVSAMAKEDAEDDSLHGLAIQGDVDRLSQYLEQNSNADVNAVDEYVSFVLLCCATP